MNTVEPTVPMAGFSEESADGAPAAGARIGRFVVEGVLGSGGMGIVLAARDPELHRQVALKLLRPELVVSSPESRDHLLREAQAMAMLAHPNVVAIYEVGRDGDQVYVAMERVDGGTLRAWLAERPRPWREIVRMFVAAGRGLAAAHAAGLVHRDFKPENVLVGGDGRPRVTDFGLTGLGLQPGAVAGTPSYMSAEQWAGEVVDARSDQFSFCVALWDAVFGERPFGGKDRPELSARVRAGELSPPPRGKGVPAWLEAALRRGLAVDPRDRWPALPALLDELERRATSSGARIAWLAAGVAVVGAAVAVVLLTRGGAPETCPAPKARADAVWSAARKAALRDHLLAVDAGHGADRFAAVAAAFDAGVAGWSAEHVASCRATKVEGRASGPTLDARMRCLDRWLGDLDRRAGIVEGAKDLGAVDDAIDGVSAMSTPASCRDELGTPLPGGGVARAEAEAITAELHALDDAARGGDLTDVVAKTDTLLGRARAIDHAPTLAATLRDVIELRDQVDAPVEALLEELTRVAAIAEDDVRAAYAWVRLVMIRGADLDQPARGDATYASADSAVLRIGDPADVRFDLLLARAAGFVDKSQPKDALALLDEAERRIADAPEADLPRPPAAYRARLAYARGNAHQAAGDLEGAVAAFRAALAARTEQLGADHPDVARIHVMLGEMLRLLDRVDEARQSFTDGARVAEDRVGDSAFLAVVLNRLAWTWWVQRKFDQALPHYDRSVAIADATMEQEHPNLAALHTDRASCLDALGRHAEAEAGFTHAIALHTAVDRHDSNVAAAYRNRAVARGKLGRHEEAIADLRQALREVPDTDPGLTLMIRLTLGHTLLEQGDAKTALAELTPAAALDIRGLYADHKPLVELELARARVELGRDRARSLARARELRAALAPDLAPELVAEIDAWLARTN